MKGMDVIIGGHRAWVEYIKGEPAYEPWRKKPELTVWLSIESPHPVSDFGISVTGFGISLPLKEYTRDELKKLIEEEGTRQWEKILAKHEAERKETEARIARREAAQEIGRKVAEAADVELLEDKR